MGLTVKALKIIGAVVVALAAVYFLAALTLIYWPAAIFEGQSPPPPARADYPHAERRFVARDGKQLFARIFGPEAETTILLVHGFGVNSGAYEKAASAWTEASGARVLALDLRGHGQSDGK